MFEKNRSRQRGESVNAGATRGRTGEDGAGCCRGDLIDRMQMYCSTAALYSRYESPVHCSPPHNQILMPHNAAATRQSLGFSRVCQLTEGRDPNKVWIWGIKFSFRLCSLVLLLKKKKKSIKKDKKRRNRIALKLSVSDVTRNKCMF